MYVNNMITGVETPKETDEFYTEAKTLFQSAPMNLHERGSWASNSAEFLQRIPQSDRTSEDTMKVLGTTWNMNSDTIFTNGSHSLSFEATTKREALKSISRFYDPLGFFSLALHSGTMETRERLG